MKVTLAIAGRELKSRLNTSVGGVVLALFLFLAGFFWFLSLNNYVAQSQSLVMNPYAASMLTLGDYLILPWFSNCMFFVLLVAPALSMGSFTQEYQQHTLTLLLTSPVSTGQIVLGKYLGLMGFASLMLLGTLHVPATLYYVADPDFGYFFGGYLAMFALMSASLSLGLFVSASTQSQMVAFLATLVAGLSLYVLSWLNPDPAGWISQLALATHIEDLLSGALRLSDMAYFLGFTVVMLFGCQQKLEGLRWS